MSWESIKHRYNPPVGRPFWACIAPDNSWCDSSVSFEVAVHWCAMDHCHNPNLSFEEEVNVMADAGYSVIHSSLLEQLADAGIIK